MLMVNLFTDLCIRIIPIVISIIKVTTLLMRSWVVMISMKLSGMIPGLKNRKVFLLVDWKRVNGLLDGKMVRDGLKVITIQVSKMDSGFRITKSVTVE